MLKLIDQNYPAQFLAENSDDDLAAVPEGIPVDLYANEELVDTDVDESHDSSDSLDDDDEEDDSEVEASIDGQEPDDDDEEEDPEDGAIVNWQQGIEGDDGDSVPGTPVEQLQPYFTDEQLLNDPRARQHLNELHARLQEEIDHASRRSRVRPHAHPHPVPFGQGFGIYEGEDAGEPEIPPQGAGPVDDAENEFDEPVLGDGEEEEDDSEEDI